MSERERVVTGYQLAAVAGALWLGLVPAPGLAPKPACQILSIPEVEQAVGAKVTVDPAQSGPDGNGADFCAWQTPDKHFVILGLMPGTSAAEARTTYVGWLTQAFGGGPPAQSVPGLGDEAQFRNYVGNLKGGVVVVRKGSTVASVEGPMSRDQVVGLARLVLARLP